MPWDAVCGHADPAPAVLGPIQQREATGTQTTVAPFLPQVSNMFKNIYFGTGNV